MIQNYQHKKPETVIYEDKTLRNTDHPTMKPVRLIKKLIVNSSESGDLILEPFLGSGTTIIASIQTGRDCYGIELDPKYFQSSVIRILKYYKQLGIDYEITLNGTKFNTNLIFN
jgi:DNA modification methylase